VLSYSRLQSAAGLALLPGIFESLGNLPANRQLNVAVDAYVDDHRAVFDRKRFVDLAEIVGLIDSEALGPHAAEAFANGENRIQCISRQIGRGAFGERLLTRDQPCQIPPSSVHTARSWPRIFTWIKASIWRLRGLDRACSQLRDCAPKGAFPIIRPKSPASPRCLPQSRFSPFH
jgi:hypothetical protein